MNRGRMESLGNDDFLYCSRPQVIDGKDDVKQKILREPCLGRLCEFIVRSYFDNQLRYELSLTFCEGAALNAIDQKTLDKCR